MPTVYRDKKCTIPLADPRFGQLGFIKDGDDGTSTLIFDKGGQERESHRQGGAVSTSAPGWVSPEEFARRKEARSRAWRKSPEGQRDYLDRHSLHASPYEEDDDEPSFSPT